MKFKQNKFWRAGLLIMNILLMVGLAACQANNPEPDPAKSTEGTVQEVADSSQITIEGDESPSTAEMMAEPEAEVEVEEAAETEETAVTTIPSIAPPPRGSEELQDGLFISLTTDDIDRAAMAVGFATKILNNTDKPVTIFMNVTGVRWVDTNIPPNVHKSGKSIQEMLQKFMDDGGVALVCPTCMVNVGGLVEAEIMDGVIIGTPEYTWSAMFAENVTIVSY